MNDIASTVKSVKVASASSMLVCVSVRRQAQVLTSPGTDLELTKAAIMREAEKAQLDNAVAIKLMLVRDGGEMLRIEAEAYTKLSGGVGIPQLLWYGQECEYYALVHELLGPSLEDLFNYCDRRFSIKTVLLLADQAIARIEHLHKNGLLHRDIKPENFLMGIGRRGNILYIVDFGLTKEFYDAERFQTMAGRPFGGTSRYASLNNHNGRGPCRSTLQYSIANIEAEQSRGDDLESLGYMLLYFALGSLPWQGLKTGTEKRNKLISQVKTNLPVSELCEGLPQEFATYINYTRSLGFNDKPNYPYLRKLFRTAFAARGFQYDNVFDWTERRFKELSKHIEKVDE